MGPKKEKPKPTTGDKPKPTAMDKSKATTNDSKKGNPGVTGKDKEKEKSGLEKSKKKENITTDSNVVKANNKETGSSTPLDGIQTIGHDGNENSTNEHIVANVQIANRYDPLKENESVDSINGLNNKNTELVKIKIPPIFISKESTDFSKLHKDVQAISKDYKIKDVKEFYKLDIGSVENYREIIKLLDNLKINYHSYRLPTEQTIDVVIKHLPTSISDSDILEELTSKGFKINKLMRMQNKEKAPIPVVVVYLKKNHLENKKIFDLDRLLHCVVAVEPKRKNYDIPQCYNCQRYGHTRNYCKLKTRCMKCSGNHTTNLCQAEIKICANCSENHPSSFKGCKYYEELKKSRYHKNDVNKNNYSPQNPPVHESFPPLNKSTVESVVSSTFSVQDHSYAKTVMEGIQKDFQEERNYQEKSSADGNFFQSQNSSNMVDSIFNMLKPIINQIIEKLKPLIQDAIIQLFNGSK